MNLSSETEALLEAWKKKYLNMSAAEREAHKDAYVRSLPYVNFDIDWAGFTPEPFDKALERDLTPPAE